MSQTYKIIGPCEVLGVQPGGTVTEEALLADGTNIGALLGFHLEPVNEPAPVEPAKTTTKKSSS